MSFKSLLFCPDERNARLVTQVLSDLDFTVECATEPFAAVKRLSDQHFDALVVDCQNEQDAGLLFKAARNSSDNHSSLSVAVVEGQAGVAKAFRIGANLVLTKPINVEQSKSTLRVARGLLRKNQPRGSAPTAPAMGSSSVSQTSVAPPRTSSNAILNPSFPGASAPRASSSFSPALEVDREPEPKTEAADAAVLESLHDVTTQRPPDPPLVSIPPASIVYGGGAQAAAAAPAPEKRMVDSRPSGAAPMVTNQPITRTEIPDTFTQGPVPAPTFSSYSGNAQESGGATKFLKIAVVIVALAAGGFFAWPKLRSSQLLNKFIYRNADEQTTDDSTPQNAPQVPAAGSNAPASGSTANTAPAAAPATFAEPAASSPAPTTTPMSHSASKTQEAPIETIEVQDQPAARATSKVTVTPKPEPLIVKSGEPKKKKQADLAPPSINMSGNNSDAAIANLIPTNVPLPAPVPGTIRISQGVSQGLLVKKVAPVYPSMAQHLHREGTVQLLATIDKYGEIKKIRVLSGDAMLAKAASDAVQQWHYRPYLLNGQPVEIETQVTIVFKAPQ